ncbi:MAG: Exonuclease SbcC [Myxococcaceae bacterium]|nr:Exonuclease SbcC [Myxococcaceae bacterium]
MSDDQGKLLDDLGDLDWDSALEEWEKNTFVPEVARDAETTEGSAPNTLAKDDVAPPVDDAAAEKSAREHLKAASSVGRQPAAGAAQGSLKDVSSEGTVIAPVPRELRAPSAPAPRMGSSKPPLAAPPQRQGSGSTATPGSLRPGAARGGLGQLFAKGASQRPPPPAPTPPPRPTSEKTRIAPPAASPEPADLAITTTGAPSYHDAETGARQLPDLFGDERSQGPLPSVTRQLVSPPVPSGAYSEEGDPTVIGQDAYDARSSRTRTQEEEEQRERSASFDSETVVADRKRTESLSDAETQTRLPDEQQPATEPRHPADDEAPTFARPSNAPGPAAMPASIPPLPPTTEREPPSEPSLADVPVDLGDERPVSRWFDADTTTSFRQRASWLEEEARALHEPMDQARALLGVSELLALVGDDVEALALAVEARDLAPDLALAWRQARQLVPRDAQDPRLAVESFDAEAARSPTPAARAHAMLMAADVLRTNGDGDAAVERWNSACKLDPADVRAPAARAALALAQGNHTSAGSDLAENSELIALDKAVATALKLRGAPRAGTDVEAMPINDGLRRARTALLANDVVAAAQAVADVSAEPSLAKAALWLSAAFGATHIAGRRGAAKSLRTLANEGETLARRQLAARGIELGDPDLVVAALSDDAPVEIAERATLLALAGQDVSSTLGSLAHESAYAPLVDALSAVTLVEANADDDAVRRAERASGSEANRALAALGRLLATKAASGVAAKAIDDALAKVPSPRGASASGVALEVAIATQRWNEVSDALSALPTGDDENAAAQRYVAAALVAERAGNRTSAQQAWREALAHGATHDSVVRAVAGSSTSGSDGDVDLGTELLRIADEMPDAPPSAILRLEALARREASAATGGAGLGHDEQASILERVHRGAPTLGIGAFLAERIGRRKGDVDEVLRWIQERRSYANDSLETALDAVREALLVADRDSDLASTRLDEAHRARPDDVALRELYERLASEPPADRGAWRERRAEKTSGPARALLYTEAALEHERAGDHASALRAAQNAREAGDTGLSRLAAERAEIETGATQKQSDDLLALAKDTEIEAIRIETYERLADLDMHGRKDPNGALAWHRTILEQSPRHKPSLRFVEHKLVGEGLDNELERVFEQIALALDGTAGGEVTGHAQLAARLKTRALGGREAGWERTGDMARLAATQPEASLWGLRALNAHARVQKDEEAALSTTTALLERTQRPSERSALLLRASEAAARLEQVADARAFLEQAAQEDPGDVVTWGFLAEVRERTGETRAAAEACESLARTSVVPEHQVLAWFDAARIWLDEVKDTERGMTALEQCAELDVTHGDVFHRLSGLYAEKHLDAELARLLEKRLAIVEDEGERVALEVELARALGEMGELAKAKAALESALAQRPDHTTALAAMAELCAKEGDWAGTEQAYVRLARLLDTPAEQSAIYEKLGEIYSVHTVNLSRAEVAYKEVLKRAPNDLGTLEKLVDIYKRQGDIAKAVETQQTIVSEAQEPGQRLQRLIDLAQIHESTARDARRSEQVLESARKEFPTSVVALRAMAEFYARQRQMPAMQILLDRAAGDARRSFAAGRFVTSLFEVLHAAYELRGRKDAARVVAATLAAVEGPNGPGRAANTARVEIMGAEARAVDPRLDDVLAPETIGPALRALFHRAGDALDAVSPIDLRALRATPLVPGTPLGTTVGAVATVVGLGALQILVSPQLGRVAIPLGSNPPALLVGEGLMNVSSERARAFVVVRAMKMILSRSSSLLRGQPGDVSVLVSALFTAFNPSFQPQGVDPKRVSEMSRRLVPALPRNLDPTVGVIALEAAGTLGNQSNLLGAAAQAWANRVALLAIGDPNGALEAIAWSKGEEGAPRGPEERAAWIARTAEARELMTFSVTDAYAEARARLGLDR